MVLREFVRTGAEGDVSNGGGRTSVKIHGDAATVQMDEVTPVLLMSSYPIG